MLLALVPVLGWLAIAVLLPYALFRIYLAWRDR
jgi:hypothetical protein